MEKTLTENNEISTEITDEPLSPSSTTTSADATFEPTIDELVNDFDDEQTLNEEEALSALENNPQDEIATLKEESEMPLEELLAKYHALPPLPLSYEPPRKKAKKSHNKKKENGKSVKDNKHQDESIRVVSKSPTVVINAEDEKNTDIEKEQVNGQMPDVTSVEEELPINNVILEEQQNGENNVEIIEKETNTAESQNQEKLKIRRSHLFELYPEQNFDEAIAAVQNQGVPLDTLYSEDEEADEAEEEEEEIDPDYVKKTIMVGSAFQAVIPGLSQYGDILPYENVDKLVWSLPSQVSEAEVEDYLLKIREIKASLADDGSSSPTGVNEKNEAMDVDASATPNATVSSKQNDGVQGPQQTPTDNKRIATSTAFDTDQSGVVKDNEQALHLLVQCGYDFKEALRRKRLNAVPLTGGTMSIWSEEECQKFEEGIQKYGKDFLKIRQQVRTRTMRELVQFYYLWKKSERRDHNFANSDTVDHMDIFLNEGEDYSSSPAPATTATGTAPSRKMNGISQSNFSIMTGNHSGCSPTKTTNNNGNKKRTAIDASTSNTTSGNSKNINIAVNNDHHSSTISLQSPIPTPTK